ncbi:MAG: DEAD/DEAH box helicase [Akkermansiaceae bacterium]|nr:DEAD/DEAH box helicase [Akkermansiaceae bacterium]
MLISALNPDRATLNFLNAYSEAVRDAGEKLQKDGAVTQIFGNHLFIQGRVETKQGGIRTSLRLQGNRWFGSATSEDEDLAGACLIATMVERMYRGTSMPESPNELNEIPLTDVLEEKLDRDLDQKEIDFVTKLEKRYRRFVIEQEIHDHDLVRLNPRWDITGYDALELWPQPPRNILEFWNYIAYAFTKKRISYPEFMNVVTDLKKVQQRIAEWEREKEVGCWYDRIQRVNERPPQPPRHPMFMRLVSTINEARFEFRYSEKEDWVPIRERAQLDAILEEFLNGALKMDPQTDILLNVLRDYADREETVILDLDSEAACRVMNRLFHQPALKGYLVNLDECYFKVVKEPLKWICIDDPIVPNCYGLQLVTAAGVHVTHSVRQLPGQVELYQSDETVFPGPPKWLESTEVEPRYSIPKSVIDSLDGVEFLRKIGATLPPCMEERVVDIDMKPTFAMKIVRGLTSADTEHVLLEVTAQDDPGRRKERLGKDDWELIEQASVKDKTLLRFIRDRLYPIPGLLEEMNFTYDSPLAAFKSRITKQFPEKFAEWAKNIPETIKVEMDENLKSLLADPVAAAIRFEVVNQEIDWFDLRVVIDVEGVTLTKEQIRALVSARGGYVRMDDGRWMRLEIKLDDAQRDAVTKLGLDPFDLSGETHRMHALQLADPRAAEVFDPKAWQKIKERTAEIKIDVKPDVPSTLNATLRPYQIDGFHFLAYLAVNGFGGILADDMGLGKTIQSITYMLWLREDFIARNKQGRKKVVVPPVLIVCPKSVLDVWAGETEKFAPGIRVLVIRNKEQAVVEDILANYDMVVINYAQLRVCGEQINSIKWLTVILDEGQQIKNPDSKAAKSARELTAFNRLVLSGTPIENRLLDMWSLMAFAMPGVLGSRAYFKKRFDKRKDSQSQNRLAARLKPFLLRRTKQQVAKDLPPRTEEEVYAKMEGVQRQLYKAELRRIQKALLGMDSDESVKKNSFAILQGLMRLRQICCHPGLVDKKYVGEDSAKLNALFYLLDQLRDEGHKVLVFSQFTTMLDIIRARLEADHRPFNYLTGATKDRKAEIEKFQTTKEPSVFLLSLKAGGAGLNLTSASYVILYDPWWNPAVESQAIDRTHRIGQKNKVIAYRLLTRDSVEEKIRVLQHQKNQLVTNVLGDEGFASSLDLNDLQFILAHGGEDNDDDIVIPEA